MTPSCGYGIKISEKNYTKKCFFEINSQNIHEEHISYQNLVLI